MFDLDQKLDTLPGHYFQDLYARSQTVRPGIQALVAMMQFIELQEECERIAA